ncbi:MAG: cytochrome c biogenesis protein ResB [Coriobacteriia bacterium]
MATRGGLGRRIFRFLRNPRAAIWLLLFTGAWMVLGTLGHTDAYSHPIFLAALAWLGASTAVCAWERTGRMLRVWRSRGTLTPAQLDRLLASDPIALPAEEHSAECALDRAAAMLRRRGLRVRRGPRLIEASSGVWVLAGSPLFHWSLVILIVLIPVGRLSRSEGMIGVVEGSARIDEAASYGTLEQGPLNSGFSALEIGVEPDMTLDFVEDGIARGEAPTVTIAADGVELTRQRVYPNHPLRYGSLMIHMDDFGLGVLYSLEDVSGASLPGQAILDFADESRSMAEPSVATYEDDSGATIATFTFSTADTGGASDAPDRRVAIEVERPGASELSTVAAAGESIELGEGLSLRVDHLGYYARLSVVDDWSVYWMYFFLVLAMVSVSVSVLVPHRDVHVLFDDSGHEPVLRLSARHGRGAPGFAASIRSALTSQEA